MAAFPAGLPRAVAVVISFIFLGILPIVGFETAEKE